MSARPNTSGRSYVPRSARSALDTMRATLLSIRSDEGATRRTSKCSGNAVVAAGGPTGVARPTNSSRLIEVSKRRSQTELRTVTVHRNAAAKADEAAAEPRREPVHAQARGVEADLAVDGLERVRQREVADSAARDVGLAR